MSELQRVPDAGLPAGYADAWRSEAIELLLALSNRLGCERCARELGMRGGFTYRECGHDIGQDPVLLKLASLHRELGLSLGAFAVDAMDPDTAPAGAAARLVALAGTEHDRRPHIRPPR